MSSDSTAKFDVDVLLGRVFNKFKDQVVIENTLWPEPSVGDWINIISWDTQVYVQECVKISHLHHLTVKSVTPYVVGMGDKNYWAYKVCVNESDVEFLQWHYKVLNHE